MEEFIEISIPQILGGLENPHFVVSFVENAKLVLDGGVFSVTSLEEVGQLTLFRVRQGQCAATLWLWRGGGVSRSAKFSDDTTPNTERDLPQILVPKWVAALLPKEEEVLEQEDEPAE